MSDPAASTDSRAPSGRATPAGRPQPTTTALAAGALFLGVAAIGAWSLATDPYLTLDTVGPDPGPAFVPWLALALLAIGGLVQVVLVGIQALRADGFARVGEFTVARLWLPAVLTALTVAYAFFLPRAGFLWSSSVYALICTTVLHWRTGDPFTWRYMVQIPVEALALVAVIYGTFGYVIHVPLP